jgi:hypothetical protein
LAREMERLEELLREGRLPSVREMGELGRALTGLLTLAWPIVLLYVAIGEGAALYAAGWAVSNRVVLGLTVGPLLALAALFLAVAVGVFVRRLPRAD